MADVDRRHALFYHGPYEVNFQNQRPGVGHYVKRDGLTRGENRGPMGVTGIKFGQMQKKNGDFVITRLQGPTTDVCLGKPIRGKGTGPNGAWLTVLGAKTFLDSAVKSNPGVATELSLLRALL